MDQIKREETKGLVRELLIEDFHNWNASDGRFGGAGHYRCRHYKEIVTLHVFRKLAFKVERDEDSTGNWT